MNTQYVLAFWLTEEKPDKTRRRRSCLGCGETQEYLTKEPAPSYVAWFKAHLVCRELYSSTDTRDANTTSQADYPKESDYPKEWDGWNVGDQCEVRSTAGSGWAEGIVTRSAPNLRVKKCGGKTEFSPFDIRRIESPLSECPQCGYAGVSLNAAGLCADCQQVHDAGPVDDPRIAPFCERMKISRAEFDAMVEAGTVDVRQFYTTELPDEAPAEGSKEE